MANDLNQCNFIGRLGNEPEVRYMPNGDAVASFSIAVGESWKDKQGQKQERTEWVRVVAFRKLGEICGEYLRKGSQVYLSGKFKTRKWEKDGIERYSTEIVASDMQMLGGRPDGSAGATRAAQQASGQGYAQASGSAPAQYPRKPSEQDFDDDIPF